jgi:probable phosphoglycerate mutase
MKKIAKLKNRYFIIRHGESKANVAHILLSHPKEGTVSFGLSPKGKKQVKISVLKNKKNKVLDANVIIYSSDFLRAKETAEIARKLLGIKKKINFHKNLRERYFGKYDKTSLDNIKIVWEHDRKNANHKHQGSESPNKVLKRTFILISQLEKKYKNKKILLVSHGDVLQILHTHVSGKPVSHHRLIPHLETAEIRELAF